MVLSRWRSLLFSDPRSATSMDGPATAIPAPQRRLPDARSDLAQCIASPDHRHRFGARLDGRQRKRSGGNMVNLSRPSHRLLADDLGVARGDTTGDLRVHERAVGLGLAAVLLGAWFEDDRTRIAEGTAALDCEADATSDADERS